MHKELAVNADRAFSLSDVGRQLSVAAVRRAAQAIVDREPCRAFGGRFDPNLVGFRRIERRIVDGALLVGVNAP